MSAIRMYYVDKITGNCIELKGFVLNDERVIDCKDVNAMILTTVSENGDSTAIISFRKKSE